MNYRRGWICVFLFTLTLINYTDRVALSVSAKPIAAEFGLSPVEMGYLLSSFLWTYVLCLIPVGLLVDRLGSKTVIHAMNVPCQHTLSRLQLPELAGELLALRIDARERLADPLLLLGDLEPVKSSAEPMVCGLSPGGRSHERTGL
jgi:hypothetical protein